MAYFDTLSKEQKNNIAYIIKSAIEAGISNKYTIAAILSIISKESEFKPKSENLSYSVKRIKEVFPSLGNKADNLGKNPEALGNAIYGGRFGNEPNEGYEYRGRGYNQLTGKDNYEYFGKKIGVDIVSNPDLVNNPEVAAKIAIAFFIDGTQALKRLGKLKLYNAENINDFKNLTDAILGIYHVNAGIGKKVNNIKSLQNKDTLGGFTKAKARIEDLFNNLKTVVSQTSNILTETVKETAKEVTEAAKETAKQITTAATKNSIVPLIVIGLVVSYFIFNKNKS
jgi:putative chitinase